MPNILRDKLSKKSGTLQSGSKNTALPIVAAALLLDDPILMENVPNITDVNTSLEILNSLGATVKVVGENRFSIDPRTVNSTIVDSKYAGRIRGLYYFLGAGFGRNERTKVSIPELGGCKIGNRPMDLHLTALENFGIIFNTDNDRVSGEIERKVTDDIVVQLPFPSRGATINTILVGSKLEGISTTIVNADQSPETTGLLGFLKGCGLDIQRRGNDIVFNGARELRQEQYSIPADKIEVATLLNAGLITGGSVIVADISRQDLFQLERLYVQMGVKHVFGDNSIMVPQQDIRGIKPTDIESGLGPKQIDADYEPIMAALFALLKGDSRISDTINPGRHGQFIPQLVKMGANISEITGTEAVIHGGRLPRYFPQTLAAREIRGGVALLLAALNASGTSVISNIEQIDRGYEGIDRKLIALGANITRVNSERF